jgi:protein-tyrosine phosphatase
MIKIMFICHGNICRSPMAEFVFKDLVEKRHLSHQFEIASSATSREEIGHPVHHGTKRILSKHGISCEGKTSAQVTKRDYDTYDYLICMDAMNVRNLMRIIGEDTENKVSLLMDFAGHHKDIEDPWYTGDFEITYADIKDGCEGLLKRLLENELSEVKHV